MRVGPKNLNEERTSVQPSKLLRARQQLGKYRIERRLAIGPRAAVYTAYDTIHGVKVALNTGFPREVAKGIIDHLCWEREGLIDAWTCSEDVGRSRPDPAMIHALMGGLGVGDPSTVMKVDDTATGIEEGLNAGAVTLGVLTGTQTKERLLQAGPHAIIESVSRLSDYLKTMGFV